VQRELAHDRVRVERARRLRLEEGEEDAGFFGEDAVKRCRRRRREQAREGKEGKGRGSRGKR
jgi:hypothetical protein